VNDRHEIVADPVNGVPSALYNWSLTWVSGGAAINIALIALNRPAAPAIRIACMIWIPPSFGRRSLPPTPKDHAHPAVPARHLAPSDPYLFPFSNIPK
jgi:hypothetical protein